MDQPKVERLLRLMMLLTSNRSHTVADLSERLGITGRSIYRYIDTLRGAGFVIKKDGNYFRIDKSSPYFKEISSLVHFTEEEAWVLKSAIESIDENNLIKQNLKKKLYTVYNYRILAETVSKGKNARNINALVQAMEEEKQVTIRGYSSANSKMVSDRRIEPFVFTTNYIQVWAFDTESGTNKLFKVSRMNRVEVCETTWQSKARHLTARIDVFRISSSEVLPVRLIMSLRAASLLTEEYPLAEKHLKRINDNRWILETEVCSYEGVGRFVSGLLNEMEKIEPEEFRNFIVKKIESGIKILEK
jgi:predicted DNA-binding transcriptional regulator YafY